MSTEHARERQKYFHLQLPNRSAISLVGQLPSVGVFELNHEGNLISAVLVSNPLEPTEQNTYIDTDVWGFGRADEWDTN